MGLNIWLQCLYKLKCRERLDPEEEQIFICNKERCKEEHLQFSGEVAKQPLASAEDKRDSSLPWVGKIPWRREWQPTLVLLPGESHGQRSLAGYSPWSCTELDMTEAT